MVSWSSRFFYKVRFRDQISKVFGSQKESTSNLWGSKLGLQIITFWLMTFWSPWVPGVNFGSAGPTGSRRAPQLGLWTLALALELTLFETKTYNKDSGKLRQ